MRSINNLSKFLWIRQLQKPKLINKTTELSDLNFEKESNYPSQVKAAIEVQGKTYPFTEKASMRGSRLTYTIKSIFNLTIVGCKAAFELGKFSTIIA